MDLRGKTKRQGVLAEAIGYGHYAQGGFLSVIVMQHYAEV